MNDNIVLQYFFKGGWIMWPILLTSVVAIAVIFERILWWQIESRRRDPKRLDEVYEALEQGNLVKAKSLAENSSDPFLRVVWRGLNHYHSSLQGALQVAAGVELERAGKYLTVLDTIVTLAPLLGLLGTVTGLMRSFFTLGNAEINVESITGGIGEALIATACGLTIAVVALIFLNYFGSRVAKFQFDLQTAATNVEVLSATAINPGSEIKSFVATAPVKSTPSAEAPYETRLAATA